jgi:hypothetical protein
VEGAVSIVQELIGSGLPLATINAMANSVTAVAAFWAAKTLRSSITDIRLLRLQPPLSVDPETGRLRDDENLPDDD